MRALTFSDISAMKGNGSSMRTVLKYFLDKGAAVHLICENIGASTERFFLVEYEELKIPLRAYDLNFYSIYNSLLARTITTDKINSHAMLTAWDILTPDTLVYSDESSAEGFLKKYENIVVKPRIGAHGEGITVGLKDAAALKVAVEHAQSIYPEALMQQQIGGDDYRLLFVDYTFVAAVKRLPASIVGDGKLSVRELVEASNHRISELWTDIRSGKAEADGTRGSISKTPIDEIIAARGESFLDNIPAKGEEVQLIDKANVSLGGQTHDITEQVNQEFTNKLSELLQNIALPLCGIDVLSTDISSPPADKKSFVIELNAAPGLRLHELPTKGEPRHVCAMVAESLISYYKQLATD